MPVLVFVPDSVYFGNSACGYEAMEAVFVNEFHHFREFVFGQDRYQFGRFAVGISSGHFVQGRSSFEGMRDVLLYHGIVVGYNAYFLLCIDTVGEVIEYDSVDPCSDKADNYHSCVIYHECGAAYGGSADGYSSTDIHMEIFVDYLGQDIKSACRCVYLEEYRLRCTEDKHEAQKVKPWVLHYGFLYRHNVFQQVQPRGQYQCGVDSLDSELLADEQVCKYQKD